MNSKFWVSISFLNEWIESAPTVRNVDSLSTQIWDSYEQILVIPVNPCSNSWAIPCWLFPRELWTTTVLS
jgi:hypothetical protein